MPVYADGLGLDVTAASGEAASAFGSTVEGYVRFTRDVGDRLKDTLTADPDMPLAHVTKGYFMKLFGTGAMSVRADKALGTATELFARMETTEREKGHLAALGAWCAGDIDGAADAWERILLDAPRDMLALRLAHFAHFYAGSGARMRDSVARVMHAWDKSHPLYGNLIGMYGFGLEESGDYRKGERYAREAVEIDPKDAWSVHAVAHVMEMEGRHLEGIDWIKGLEPHWSTVHNFRFHVWWHRALFHLERYELDEVLALYDAQVASDLEADQYLDVVNAAALLWRLELYGMRVGPERWAQLADIARNHLDDHELIFVSLHYLMALLGAGRMAEATEMTEKLRAYAESEATRDQTQARITRQVGLALAEAMSALRTGNPARAVSLIWPVRYDIQSIGGSHAQRDVFEEMLVDASLKGGKTAKARALLSERTERKPKSAWSWERYGEALGASGLDASAARARAAELRSAS
ncbi:tetratricopeptide repeat protein [Nisaea sp.]|uniref:tetratricopeptide repeat protein n=1 Tax=Nisaea sp. TaxID=2024842 RepID=UPI003B521E9A